MPTKKPGPKRFMNNRILVMSDDHAPFHHQDALAFLGALKSEINPDRVVHLGDLMDSYIFSRYPKDPGAMNANDELKRLRKYTSKLKELFPQLLITESNHDSRLWDRARVAGIPKGLIIPYLTLLGADDVDWKLKRDYTLTVDSTREQVYFCHYRIKNVIDLAKMVGCHAVQGHTHTSMGINEIATPNRPLWGMQVGSLISDSKYAFAYNKQQLVRPVLGCGIIIEGVPNLVRMRTKKSGRWDGKLNI